MSHSLSSPLSQHLDELTERYQQALLALAGGYEQFDPAELHQIAHDDLTLLVTALETKETAPFLTNMRERVLERLQSGFEVTTLMHAIEALENTVAPLVTGVEESRFLQSLMRQAYTLVMELTVQRLREAEAQYRLLSDRLPIGVFVYGQDGIMLYAGEQAAATLGYDSPEEMVGRSIMDFVAPDERPRAAEIARRRLSGQDTVQEYELRLLRKDGRELDTLMFATSLVYHGQEAVQGAFIDLTQQKQQTRQLNRLARAVQSAHEVVVITDNQGRIQYVNPAFEQVTGYTASEALGQNPRILKSGRQSDAFYAQMWQTITAGQVWQGEVTNRRKDGSLYEAQLTISPVRNAAGEVENFVAIQRDITEQRRLQERLNALLERRAEQVHTGTEIAQEIAAAPALDELLRRVVTLIKERFGYYHAQIFRYEPALDAVVLVVGYGEVGEQMRAAGHRLEMGKGVVGAAAATGHPILASDVTQDPDWVPNSFLPDTKGELAVPIKLRGEVLGILDVQSDTPGTLSEDDQLLLEGLCGQIAIAMESTRLRQETEAQLRELDALYRATTREGWQAVAPATPGYLFDRERGLEPTPESWTPPDQEAVTVPLLLRGEPVGVVGVEQDPRAPLTDDEITLIQSVAEQAAQALESARLFQETQARAAELTVLNELGQTLTAILDVDQVIEEIYQGVSRLFDATNFYLALYDTTTDIVSFPLVVEDGERRQWKGRHLGRGLTEYVVHNRQPLLIPENIDQWLEEYGVEAFGRMALSWLGVPMTVGDQVIGVIAVQTYDTPRLYDEHDRDLLMSIASQAAIAVQNARLYQRTQSALIESQKLYQATRRIGQLRELEPLVQEIANAARHLIDANYSIVLILDPQTGAIEHIKADGVDLEHYPIVRLPEGKGLLASVLQGQVIRTYDIATHPDAAGLPEWHFAIKALLGVPLMRHNQVQGVILAGNIEGQRAFTEQDERLLGTFAAQAIIALENRRLFEAEARRRQEAESLQQVATALTATLDMGQVFDLVLEHLGRLVAYDSATIFLTEGPYMVVKAARGLPDIDRVLETRFDIAGNTLFQQLQSSAQPLIIADAQADPRFLGLGGTGYVRGWLGVPLISKGQTIGCITIDSRQPGAFDARDAALAQTLANQAAVAIENTRLFKETQRALQEVETTHRQYLQTGWEELLRTLPAEAWGYVDGPDGLRPAGDFWQPEIEQAALAEGIVTLDETESAEGAPRTALAVPIKLRGQTIGVLDFYDEQPDRRWTEEQKAILQAVADQLAQALETQRLFEQTRRRAARERLTGEIVGKIRAAGDVHDILETAAQELGRALGVSRALVRLRPSDGDGVSEADV